MDPEGVGARQGLGPGPDQGGGYLDICTSSGPGSSDRDVELRELRQIGLSRVWMDVARVVGPRLFLEIWRLLDRDELIEQEGRLRLTIPRFRQYQRYQRNRYIQALAHEGHDASAIRDKVTRELGEEISVKHVSRLMKG